ncbi:uncharacterized protein LOC128957670 [Oppia nitens]|uniref:uncharacterized protein LOC128957670 n=1 Tax=Oppia nitens TaxID=1686743 RepID=UPI0023DBC669|nr:uncharacterized protein LOC128957670 [Oppia nitens]
MLTSSDETLNEVVVSVVFDTQRQATIAYKTLIVDKEVRSDGVIVDKHIKVDNNLLTIEVKSNRLKRLRVCVKSLLQSLDLIIETIDKFDIKDKAEDKANNE